MLRKIIFLICIICSFFLALTLVSAVNISDCQELNITNTVYSLTQNVDSSTGSAENCFNITANNVTLDCNGFEINYSSIVKVGNGISIIGQNFTTIKNCIMKYSQAGNIIFLVMANNGLIQNNTIEVGANSEAIRIWGSNYNVVTQNSISSIGTGSTAIILTTSSDHNNITFNNIIGGSLMNYGIYLYYSNFSYVASNIIDMGRGYSYGLGVRGAGDYNTIFNNTITTSGNNGYGLYVDIFTSSNIFTSNRITTYGQSADGIFIETRTKNNSFSLMDVRTNNTGYPLVVGQLSNNFTFSDSLLDASLSGITSVNISKTNDCFANFTNVTHLDLTPFDLSWSSVANFTLNAMWYLDLNVFNTTSQLEGANVSLYDRNHNLIFSELTNSSGMIPRKTLLEYTKNLTASVYYTNFNLTVTKTGFNDSVLSINLTSNQFRNVVLYKPGETIYPTLTIFSPINTTYYINQSIAVEFSADPSYQEMWYTVDCGATNHTYLGFTSVNFTINSSKSIVFYANSTMGNVSSSAINFSIANLPANTTIASTQSSLEINNTIEMVVLAYKSAMKVIEVPVSLANKPVTISLNQIASNSIAYMRDVCFNLTRASSKNYSVEFQINTTITATAGWDGNINIPIVNDSSFSVDSGTIDSVITIGSNSNLNLSKPARIVLGDMSGKAAAWSEENLELTKILTYCDSSKNPTNIQANGTRECYINSDNDKDLIIWSYHLSNFAAYTPTASSTSSSSSGGGGTYTPADYSLTEKQLEKGYNQILGKDESIQFELDGKIYFVKIKKIDNLKAIVTISNAIQVTLINGEERLIDVILDGKTYTLYMKVNFINSVDKIGLTIRKIGVKDTSGGIAQTTGMAVSSETSNYETYTLVAVLTVTILVVLFIIFVAMRKRKNRFL